MDKVGFSVHCPTKGVANKVYDIMVSHGARRNTDIVDLCIDRYKGKGCLAMSYASKEIARGTLKYNLSEEGRKSWDFYWYSNDLEEKLIKDGRFKLWNVDLR